MGFASQSTQQKFPFPYDAVFDGLVLVLPRIGFKLRSQDKLIGRITASTGVSVFSWGENLAIVVEKVDEKCAVVSIDSALKFGLNVGGAHRHAKNFNTLIQALSVHLQGDTRDHTAERAAEGDRTRTSIGEHSVVHDGTRWICERCQQEGRKITAFMDLQCGRGQG